MNYLAIVIFILIGELVLIISHFVWRGMVNIAKKTVFNTVFGPKRENGEREKVTYGDIKYKNQQFIISIVGFHVFLLVLIVVFIWLPDMWFGYQIILSTSIGLFPGILIGIAMNRYRQKK